MAKRKIDIDVLTNVKRYVDEISKHYSIREVYLFGSYAKKSADKNSDLDFVIDTKETLIGFKLYSLITQIEEAFQKQVDAFEKTEIIENSKIDEEIKRTGVLVYEK